MPLRLSSGVAGPHAALALTAIAIGVLCGIDPKLGVAAVLGMMFALLVLADVTIGLCAFALLAFLEAIPALGGPVLSFDKAAGAVLVVSWLATITTRTDTRIDFFSAHPGVSYVLAALIGWAALSALWAEDLGRVTENVMRFTLTMCLFLIVYTAIRERQHVRWIVVAFVTATAFHGATGLIFPPDPAQEDRLAGFVGEPNQLAAALVSGLALAVALAAVSRFKPLMRTFALIAAGLCIVGLFLTASRAGLVALAMASIVGIFMAGRWRGAAATAGLVVAIATVGYFGVYAPIEARERVTQFEGGTGRTDIWTVGWRMVEDKPLLGVGAGNFQVASVHYLLEPGALLRDDLILDNPKVAHNIYLQELAELGIVGASLYIFVLAFSMVCMLRAARTFQALGDSEMEILARGIFVALVGFLTAQFFASEVFSKQLWLMLGLGPALLALARRQAVEE